MSNNNTLDNCRIVFFLAVALTSSALIIERMEGLLDRSWVAGVSPGEILFSHVVTQFVVMCGQTALVLIFMILVFGVECKGDIGWVIVLTILQGLCGMCFGTSLPPFYFIRPRALVASATFSHLSPTTDF
jgi:ABC-type multidrug transport system permease subunit